MYYVYLILNAFHMIAQELSYMFQEKIQIIIVF